MRGDTIEFNSYKQAADPTLDFICDCFDSITSISTVYYFQMAYPFRRMKPICDTDTALAQQLIPLSPLHHLSRAAGSHGLELY